MAGARVAADPAEVTPAFAANVAQDFTVQASITNVLKNTRLITEEARRSALASPMLDVCHTLYTETAALGHGQSDMAAIIRAIESRTEAAVSAVVSREAP